MNVLIAIARIGFDQIVSVLFYAALVAGCVVLALAAFIFAVSFAMAVYGARHPRDDRFVLVVDDWHEDDHLDVPAWFRCRCCNGAMGYDCICPADCGMPRCQAADPEEARHA